MASLSDYFERIYVLNLPDRSDRRARIERHLEESGLLRSDQITWARAIPGDLCRSPSYFQAGHAAWGCLQSHLRLVQDALIDGLTNYLVLEDDAVFHPRAPMMVERLMRELPQDWGQLYLGGQHLLDPVPSSGGPFVVECRNVNRSHAYAVHRRAMVIFHRHIAHAPDYIEQGAWHVDHQLGLAHERNDWKTYAPAWWLAGQDAGKSNISGALNPPYWWHPWHYSSGLPFIFAPQEITPDQAEILRASVHFGRDLKPDTLQACALDAALAKPEGLQEWLIHIAREALDQGVLPGIQHPMLKLEQVASCWSAGVREFAGEDLSALLDYPFNGLFPHPLNESGLL